MTDLNPVKTLRERLGMTQAEFGKLLPSDRSEGLSVSGVAKLETLPTPEQAEVLLALSERAKSIEHISYFKRLLGREEDADLPRVNLLELEPHEHELAEALIEMYRHPDPDSVLQQNIRPIVLEIRKPAGRVGDIAVDSFIKSLSREDRETLGRFLKKQNAMSLITGFLGGDRNEIVRQGEEERRKLSKNQGERMAK